MKITDKYVFFWSGIYSQWYQAPMEIDGITYNCCEQYMMHKKALLFNDTEIAKMIMETSNPSDQKRLGRLIKGFDKSVWDEVNLGIVYKGNLMKFKQNPELAKELLETGDRLLVEASPYDRIWGIGMSEDDEDVEDALNWKGQNLLGWAITLVKQELKSK